MRRLAFILVFFAAVLVSSADETNYFCIICGKGPLTGRIWMSKWGAVCDDCYQKYQDRCSICGLPIHDGFVKTADGRFICKYDKANAVLDVSEAREVFYNARRELVELFGQIFALQYPDVSVNLFDVDYWSEKGRENGLHKYGFASTRKSPDGECTHLVAFLSGRLRDEITATAAHEYTHLWINENCPANREINDDTLEAICELAAYKLMEQEKLPEMQKQILDNSYTHGEIKKLIEIEKQRGMSYILDWVKNGTTATLPESNSNQLVPRLAVKISNASAVKATLPEGLKLDGLLAGGADGRVIICGVSFVTGQVKSVKLLNRIVTVRCKEIRSADVVLEVEDVPGQIVLRVGEMKLLP